MDGACAGVVVDIVGVVFAVEPDGPPSINGGAGAVGAACVALAGGSEVVTCANTCTPPNASNTQLSLTSLAAVRVFIMLAVPRVRALRSDAYPAPAVSQ